MSVSDPPGLLPLANEAASGRRPCYQLRAEIARGGMGAVLRAFDPELGRELAVKVLLEEHRHDPVLVRRFLEEARTHGQLQHPGVAPLHELGCLPDGRPFFAMKLVEGRTLSALLKERPGPAAELPHFLVEGYSCFGHDTP